MLTTEMNRWNIIGPLSLAVLEGQLRRKSSGLVDTNGVVLQAFTVKDIAGGQTAYPATRRLNRIGHGLAMFEQAVLPRRGRPCLGWNETMNEIGSLYPGTGNTHTTIDEWRNDVMHGSEYWVDKGAVVLNLISLLVLDEIDPDDFNHARQKTIDAAAWNQRTTATGAVAPWFIYPPDL